MAGLEPARRFLFNGFLIRGSQVRVLQGAMMLNALQISLFTEANEREFLSTYINHRTFFGHF